MSRRIAIALVILLAAAPASAHELRPAYLELRQTSQDAYDVLFKVPAGGESLRLGLYVEFPDDVKKTREPANEYVNGAFVERYGIVRAGGLAGSTIRIRGLDVTTAEVLVRLEGKDGRSQVVRLTSARPELTVEASPTAWQVALTYMRLGRDHIVLGVDHLLFVLGLLLIVPDRWMLLKTITSFTVAHSLTLAAATLGYASAPVAPLNAAIALSILFLGPEIVRYRRGETSLTIRHPWIVAFAFGLLHGFGFASGLSTLGIPSGEIPWALLCFNLGVEAGQIGFVLLVLLLMRSLANLEFRWPPWVEPLPAYAVGSLGAFWTIQRTWMMLRGPS